MRNNLAPWETTWPCRHSVPLMWTTRPTRPPSEKDGEREREPSNFVIGGLEGLVSLLKHPSAARRSSLGEVEEAKPQRQSLRASSFLHFFAPPKATQPSDSRIPNPIVAFAKSISQTTCENSTKFVRQLCNNAREIHPVEGDQFPSWPTPRLAIWQAQRRRRWLQVLQRLTKSLAGLIAPSTSPLAPS
jgi:hypothetical protein